MKYPKKTEVNGHIYNINTNFRIAIECDQIARDTSISDYERSLAILYKLYGDEGLKNQEDFEGLLNNAIKYLKCGLDETQDNETEENMDFEQDMWRIEASFQSDYKIDLENKNMHFWKFMRLMNGLTEDCVLNRTRYIRDFDLKDVKDPKEKEKWLKQKELVALKKNIKPISDKAKKSQDKFFKMAGIKR